MNNKIKYFLLLIFLFINFIAYFLTQKYTESIIESELEENADKLETHYNILLTAQTNISYAIYKSILRNTDVKTLLNTKISTEEQVINREILHTQLKEQYETAKKQGVLQLQFVDTNNISFLRVHKPSKFGDDLTNIRLDYKQVNETLKPVKIFTQGRTAHGFRNVFPIFNDEKKHIGAMEISFSSDRFEWYLNNIGKIHTHFLIKKDLFDSKAWDRNDLVIQYHPSKEHKDYMLSFLHLNKEVCDAKEILQLNNVKEEIASMIRSNKAFSSYKRFKGKVIVYSFLPVKNIDNETAAWFVDYEESLTIKSTLRIALIAEAIIFVLSLLMIYFLVKNIQSKQKIQQKREEAENYARSLEQKEYELQKQYNLFDEVLNATHNILFITDFKNILFSNKAFSQLLRIEKRKNIMTNNGHYIMNCVYKDDCEDSSSCRKNFNILDIFIVADGYLHKELIKGNEEFISLIEKTEEKDRVVSVLDEYSNPKAYHINMIKLENNGDYLVTLSDITEIKEELIEVGKKVYKDGLTGVYNRGKFDEVLKDKLKSVKRYKTPFSIAILDIDKFKNFNDTYGHLIGDEVLIMMAQTLKNAVRETDTFARWGGEEFVILFENTDIASAQLIADKLREIIQENEHPSAGRITASFGITQYKDGDTVTSLFKRCDEALYNAKENGRDRVEIL